MLPFPRGIFSVNQWIVEDSVHCVAVYPQWHSIFRACVVYVENSVSSCVGVSECPQA